MAFAIRMAIHRYPSLWLFGFRIVPPVHYSLSDLMVLGSESWSLVHRFLSYLLVLGFES